MFQIVDPKTNKIIFEGDVDIVCKFANMKKISAHIYFDESKYLNQSKGKFTQMIGIFDKGRPYWIPFANISVGKC